MDRRASREKMDGRASRERKWLELVERKKG